MKILLAVDGSPFTKKMLAYLVTHPELFGAHNAFTVFTATAALPPRARAAVGADVAHGYYEEEATKVDEPVLEFLGRHGITPQVVHAGALLGALAAGACTRGAPQRCSAFLFPRRFGGNGQPQPGWVDRRSGCSVHGWQPSPAAINTPSVPTMKLLARVSSGMRWRTSSARPMRARASSSSAMR